MDDPSMRTLVLLYLSAIEDGDRTDYDASTPGIAEAVELGDDTLSDRVELLSALSELKREGYAEEHTQLIESLGGERNIYSLTDPGRQRAVQLRDEIESGDIEVVTDGGVREVQLSRIDEFLDAETPLVAALARSSDGRLVLDENVDPLGGTEFVDREAERDWLFDRLDRASEGDPQVAMLTGEPGVGKTTLLEELATTAEDRGGTVLLGQCRRDVDQPFRVVLEAIDDLPDRSANELRSLLADRETIDVRDEQRLSARRAELVADVAEAFESLDVEGPVICAFDDLQWADPTTTALIGGIADQLQTGALLLVGACRLTALSDDAFVDRLGSRLTDADARLDLDRLDREASESLIARLLGTDDVPEEFADNVYDLTAGNPLFVTESITGMLESGTVDPAVDRFPESRSDLQVPDAVEEAIASRFDHVDDRTRELLDIGSLVGDAMPRPVLETAANLTEASFLDAAGILLGSGVWSIGDEGDVLYFESGVVRETLRDRLDGDRERTLHRRIADAYRTVQNDIEAGPAAVAYHYHEGEAYEAALEAYLDAATAAEAVYAQETAIEAYEAALSVARELDDEREDEILERMGDAHTILGEYDAARQQFQSVVERSNGTERVRRAHRKIAETYEKQGQYDRVLEEVDRGLDGTGEEQTEVPDLLARKASALGMMGERERALEVADRAVSVAESTDDELARARALRVAGTIHRQHGEIDAARETLETASEVVRDAEDEQELAAVLKELGTTQLRGNEYESALSTYDRCFDRYEQIGDSHGLCSIYNNRGVIYHYLENLEAAREQYEAGLEIADRIGDRHGMAKFYTNLGYIEITFGNFETAMEWSDEAEAVTTEIGDRNGLISAYEIRSEVEYYRNDLDAARDHAEQAVSVADEIGDKNRKTGSLYLLGQARLQLGNVEGAIDAFETGIEIGERHGITQKAALNRFGAAQAYLAADRLDDATRTIEPVNDADVVVEESAPVRIAYLRYRGAYDEAAALIERHLDEAQQKGMVPFEARLRYERAALAVDRGEPNAQEYVETAIETAAGSGIDLIADWVWELRDDL